VTVRATATAGAFARPGMVTVSRLGSFVVKAMIGFFTPCGRTTFIRARTCAVALGTARACPEKVAIQSGSTISDRTGLERLGTSISSSNQLKLMVSVIGVAV
jgi:hypothetical protein